MDRQTLTTPEDPPGPLHASYSVVMDNMHSPRTGPERGAALRSILRRHEKTVEQFARLAGVGVQTVHMLINGGRSEFGRDLASRTTETVAARISKAISTLEPSWRDADLWAALGIAPERQAMWALGRSSQGPSRASERETDLFVDVVMTWGGIVTEGPVRLTITPVEVPGWQVWQVGQGAAILRRGESGQGRHLGTLVSLEPL